MSCAIAVALALLAAVPAFLMRFAGLSPSTEVSTLLFGAGIVGAAFAISWAAEASEHDIPRALALTVVALLAVLPEYAVDIVFAYKAGSDPTFAPYAVANMTGSNRLLLGLGWPTIAVLAWIVNRHKVLELDRGSVLPLAFLGAATIYSFTLPFRAAISPLDSVVLVLLFAAYAILAARQETHEPELVGPAAVIGALPAALLAVRGKASAALALLLSAKVNQWTLLVGSLPLAYSFGAGHLGALPLDQRQTGEVLLTAAQSLFGVAVLASLSLSLVEASLLGVLFLAQLIAGGILRAGMHSAEAAAAE